MSYPTNPQEAARAALATHDALRKAVEREPECDPDGVPVYPERWLRWHTRDYKPAHAAWDAAMRDLAAAIGPIGRHPFTFRPICEQIIAEGPQAVLVAANGDQTIVEAGN